MYFGMVEFICVLYVVGESIYYLQVDVGNWNYYQLCDVIVGFDGEGFVVMVLDVDQQWFLVVGIDQVGVVVQYDVMLMVQF